MIFEADLTWNALKYYCYRPYYETRANYNGLLKTQKNRITDLDSKVREAKTTYNEALQILEQISEEIHRMRSETSELPNNSSNLNGRVQPEEIVGSITLVTTTFDLHIIFV